MLVSQMLFIYANLSKRMQTTRGNMKTCSDFAYVQKAKWAWKQNDKQIVQPRKLVEKRDVRKKNTKMKKKTHAAKQQLTIKMHWVKCNQESDGKMPQVYFVWRHFFSFSFWLLDTVGNVKGVWLSPNADTSFSFLNFFPIIIISFFVFFCVELKNLVVFASQNHLFFVLPSLWPTSPTRVQMTNYDKTREYWFQFFFQKIFYARILFFCFIFHLFYFCLRF